MTLADVNVLIYAFRPETKLHAVCKSWLDGTVRSAETFAVSSSVLAAVARILTNRRVFSPPNTLEQAFAYCDNLMMQPHCQTLEPGPQHWAIFKRLCAQANIVGPSISDAWHAALAIEHNCTWITCDRDFARFPGLDWREPFATSS